MTDNIYKSMEGMSLHRQQGSYSQSPSLRSSNTYLPASDPQSASARFERFFNNPSNASPTLADQQSSSPNFQHQSASSLGPGSSAAGLASNGVFGSFGHNFGAGGGSGAFNQGSSANQTVPALRTKSSNLRQGIPSQWSSANNDEATLNGIGPAGVQQNNAGSSSQYLPSTTNTAYLSQGSGLVATSSTPADDDIIPTAIVVKNIPFSIKKEQLLQIIEDLQIPMPYAFNYHFDQGVFRGLAFANFRSGEEADAVVAALNGFDVSGRKLRVEYKKVLQAGEKERIEKEKAIKRMQSMQMEKERERMRRQTVSSGSSFTLPPRPAESDPIYNDYAEATSGPGLSYLPVADTQNEDTEVGGTSDLGGRKEELDLNDPATLEIYSRVLLFKDDRMRDELSFSRNLTTSERRIVHMVSKKLGLFHYSLGEGEERHVIVTKNEVDKGHKSVRSPASTIGRSNRGEGNSSSNNGFLAPGTSHTTGRTGLRMKKSAPDMKRPRDRVEEEGFGGLSSNFVFGGNGTTSNSNSINSSIFTSNGAGILSRKSNGNLREGYSATTGRRPHSGGIGGAAGLQSLFSSPFDVPPVPSLPTNPPDSLSHSPLPSPIGAIASSNNGSFSSATSQHVLRQPAGPGGNNRNFAQRSRIPLNNTGLAMQQQQYHSQQQQQHQGGMGAGNTNDEGNLNGYDELDDRFGTLGNLTDDDVRTHEPLEV